MVDPQFFYIKAQMVIGINERSILLAASNKIDSPTNTTVGMLALARKEVSSLVYQTVDLDMTEADFLRHKRNLLSEMNEAINAAIR